MNVNGKYTFNASRQAVWDALQDPVVLAAILPGCQKLEKTAENEYEGALRIRIGTLNGAFKGKLKLSDLDEPASYNLHVKGQGPLGFIDGKGGLVLSGEGDETELVYQGDAKVGGRIASVGQRLMERSSKAIIKQSLEGLSKQIAARQAPPVVEEPVGTAHGSPKTTTTQAAPPSTPPPSQTQFAFGVAKSMAEDMLQGEDGPNPALIVAAVVGGILIVNTLIGWFAGRVAKRVVKLMKNG